MYKGFQHLYFRVKAFLSRQIITELPIIETLIFSSEVFDNGEETYCSRTTGLL